MSETWKTDPKRASNIYLSSFLIFSFVRFFDFLKHIKFQYHFFINKKKIIYYSDVSSE